jgi:IS1 family transposase
MAKKPKPRFHFSDKVKEVDFSDDFIAEGRNVADRMLDKRQAQAASRKPKKFKIKPELVKSKLEAKKKPAKKQEAEAVPHGLVPYLDQFDFSNVLSFADGLEEGLHTLQLDIDTEDLPPVKVKPVSTDANRMYSHYVNRDGQATSVINVESTSDWLARFLKDTAKFMRPPSVHDGWIWGGALPKTEREDQLGRFYLSVYHSFAVEFWEEMFYIKQDLRRSNDDIKYKMASSYEALKRGDCAVVYFAADMQQLRLLRLLEEMIRKNKIWFKENIPLFTAQMLDNHGEPIRGLSFGQNPALYSSFGYERACALADACHEIRIRDFQGEKLSKRQVYWIVAKHLKERNVDINYPAFNIGGTIMFKVVLMYTDQYQRYKNR